MFGLFRDGTKYEQTYSHTQRLDAGDHAANNLTAWLVIAGSLDQEMLVPDVTLSVIKPN